MAQKTTSSIMVLGITALCVLVSGCIKANTGTVLFVSDDYSDSIARIVSFREPADAKGDVRPDTWLEGEDTEIGIWAGPLLTDSHGSLYVLAGTSVIVFENASEADGNQSPDRVAELEDLSDIIGGMAFGPTEEWLLLVDSDDNRFKTYADPTGDTFDGPVPLAAASAADEELDIPAGAMYAGARLYVKDRLDGDIYAYSGPLVITIKLGPSWRVGSFFIDADDNLYATNTTHDVAIYHHVSQLSGDVDPDAVLTIPNAETLGGLIVGSDGTGYITDATRNAIYIYRHIAIRDGEVAPDGTIRGPHTGLSGPGFLALYEPQE